MKKTSLARRMAVLLNPALVGALKSRPFDSSDCKECEYNHANFSDDFDKSGHCYLFRDAPEVRCGKRRPCAVEENR